MTLTLLKGLQEPSLGGLWCNSIATQAFTIEKIAPLYCTFLKLSRRSLKKGTDEVWWDKLFFLIGEFTPFPFFHTYLWNWTTHFPWVSAFSLPQGLCFGFLNRYKIGELTPFSFFHIYISVKLNHTSCLSERVYIFVWDSASVKLQGRLFQRMTPQFCVRQWII